MITIQEANGLAFGYTNLQSSIMTIREISCNSWIFQTKCQIQEINCKLVNSIFNIFYFSIEYIIIFYMYMFVVLIYFLPQRWICFRCSSKLQIENGSNSKKGMRNWSWRICGVLSRQDSPLQGLCCSRNPQTAW